ncbi:MAG: hypothetical protein R2824_17280 [Saprospiraceae bacterium]|nr:hypothetical protein [Lewinella sp.]
MTTFKKVKRFILRSLILLIALLVLAGAILLGPALWRHWVSYPDLEKARAEIWAQYQPVRNFTDKTDYKGVLHAHCFWSHDSRGVLAEILPAAKKAKLDFIFFSDHIRNEQDTFPRALHGVYDHIVLESGTETRGLMVSPMRDTVIDWHTATGEVIKEVVRSGGFVGYVHSEEDHEWDNPFYQAMEIYNIHTDLLDEDKNFLLSMILNALVNGRKYRHWVYRELFDAQTEILRHWDALNDSRQIVGFAAVDAHHNQGIRARYTDDGRVEWVGPNAKTIKKTDPGWKEKWLLHEPNETGWAFQWDLDTYFASFNYVNNHVLCDTLTDRNIMDNLIKGHVYISFESLAEARGFQFFSQDKDGIVNAIMGDSLKIDLADKLTALSPFPVKFTLLKNGVIIDEQKDVYTYEYRPGLQAGRYRIEASLFLAREWVPWVCTNPIYLY